MPIFTDLAPGLTATDYSIGGPSTGILSPLAAADTAGVPDTPRGATKWGNYVRYYPDLLTYFREGKSSVDNIYDFGKEHWKEFGKASGRRNPDTLPGNPALPYLLDTAKYDFTTGGTSTPDTGLPMPDVPGYRYVYPMYEWEGSEGKYIRSGYKDDMDIYPYYPYTPGSLSDRIYDDDGKMSDRILIGMELIRE